MQRERGGEDDGPWVAEALSTAPLRRAAALSTNHGGRQGHGGELDSEETSRAWTSRHGGRQRAN